MIKPSSEAAFRCNAAGAAQAKNMGWFAPQAKEILLDCRSA